MNTGDIARKRSVLFSARIRFSPETQPVRETAIDKILEQNLLVADGDRGLTLQEIEREGAICFAGGTPAISRLDMQKSLKRLVQSKRVIASGKQDQKRYRLSEQALQELWAIQQYAEARFAQVVSRLFGNAEEGPFAYTTPFLECLCIIFSRLGEAYVRLIKGEVDFDELLRLPSVLRALREVKAKYPSIDHSLFEAVVFSFFQDSDPDYDAIKWNMAQNYYVAKALGLDPSGYLLSEGVFGNAVFYLDTNVIIDALEPQARYYRSFKALGRACRQLQIELNVCQISLDELRRVVEDRREIIAKVADQIPDDTAPKISGLFFQLYREQLASTGTVNFDTLFASFDHPMERLAELYEVELIDDLWFIEAENQPQTEKFVQRIKLTSQARRHRPKGNRSAFHDALLLRWIQLEREQTARNTWLVTLDNSLPSLLLQEEGTPVRPLAITLDALLQWISPMAIRDDAEDEAAAIFSEAVKYQLLPQESFFDLRDFLVFAEMEWSCKELPAEDVEECIRYLKTSVPGLDPSSPADREKLAHEISKFFADPGRKYKQEVQRLEAEMAEREDEYKCKLEERDKRIEKLERERVEQEEKKRKEALKRSARIRMSAVVLLFLAIEAVAVYFAWQYGEGTNFFQKVKNLWELPTIAFAVSVVLSWFILGRERIRALGWPFTKLLKDE
jgi:hypothetical protein